VADQARLKSGVDVVPSLILLKSPLFLAANAMNLEKGSMTPNRVQADIKKELPSSPMIPQTIRVMIAR
jgi:hypothetical protein